ncbi:MAG: DegT/DnrJ/EryC1/StrS family aminotransferase [Fibrobacter sp.]|jgi:dTDP-4-amino-4,6-dideoxygalactose transaminase|nr:DegT/DnrJ/EryC1/StrS family aminotransferase [Fibrobacter sp.]
MDSDIIPFSDINAQVQQMETSLMQAIGDVLRSSKFISGPAVEQFEHLFAEFCTCRFAIGVGSGTDALRFALIASGVKQGDMVITVPNTFIATSEAITQAGAIPVFVDVDETTFNMSGKKLNEYLESNCFVDEVTAQTIHTPTGRAVSAVVPVHLYGQMADMDEIGRIADKYGLMIIEDACQAHGASYYSKERGSWLRAGTIGKAAAFSFYPGKNLGAFGEAGAVTTNDPAIAETVKMLRDHGQIKKYFHEMEGYNGRLDTIQAAVLNVKIRYLERWNRLRRERAEAYNALLEDISPIITPLEPLWARSVYHLYVIRTAHRDMLQGFLKEQGIETGLHYPVPLHQQKAYRALGYRTGSFPVSEKLSKEILSLPMFPSLTEQQQEKVAQSIRLFSREYLPPKNQK